jgi:hypothetical protein
MEGLMTHTTMNCRHALAVVAAAPAAITLGANDLGDHEPGELAALASAGALFIGDRPSNGCDNLAIGASGPALSRAD